MPTARSMNLHPLAESVDCGFITQKLGRNIPFEKNETDVAELGEQPSHENPQHGGKSSQTHVLVGVAVDDGPVEIPDEQSVDTRKGRWRHFAAPRARSRRPVV